MMTQAQTAVLREMQRAGEVISEYALRNRLRLRSVPVKQLKALAAEGFVQRVGPLGRFEWALTEEGRRYE